MFGNAVCFRSNKFVLDCILLFNQFNFYFRLFQIKAMNRRQRRLRKMGLDNLIPKRKQNMLMEQIKNIG